MTVRTALVVHVVDLAAQSVDLLQRWPEHVDAGVLRMDADSGRRQAYGTGTVVGPR